MKALLLKDYLVVSKQLRIMFFIIPMFALMAADSMIIFAVLLGAALSMTAFSYDERSGWAELARMMPYSKFELVFSKYVFSYLGMIGAAVLVAVGQTIGAMVNAGGTYDIWGILWIAICGALLFTAIQMPMLFKFGVEKARLVYFVSMGVAGASGALLQQDDIAFVMQLASISPLVWLAIAMLCNAISVWVSLSLKQNNT